ncbi:MAG TPA: hypothetical protein VMV45_01435 [Casimicrobiaceae bacterium]|nr:hypothetical protein [Casimicrobiaceae bacterium]
MNPPRLSEEDVRAILKLIAEAEHLVEFRLRYGDMVIEIRNPPDASVGPLPADRGGNPPQAE